MITYRRPHRPIIRGVWRNLAGDVLAEVDFTALRRCVIRFGVGVAAAIALAALIAWSV